MQLGPDRMGFVLPKRGPNSRRVNLNPTHMVRPKKQPFFNFLFFFKKKAKFNLNQTFCGCTIKWEELQTRGNIQGFKNLFFLFWLHCDGFCFWGQLNLVRFQTGDSLISEYLSRFLTFGHCVVEHGLNISLRFELMILCWSYVLYFDLAGWVN